MDDDCCCHGEFSHNTIFFFVSSFSFFSHSSRGSSVLMDTGARRLSSVCPETPPDTKHSLDVITVAMAIGSDGRTRREEIGLLAFHCSDSNTGGGGTANRELLFPPRDDRGSQRAALRRRHRRYRCRCRCR